MANDKKIKDINININVIKLKWYHKLPRYAGYLIGAGLITLLVLAIIVGIKSCINAL